MVQMQEVVAMNRALSQALFEREANALNSARLLELRNWMINGITFPVIDITFSQPDRNSFRVRLLCNDWNEQPPSVELLSADGSYLEKLPSGSGVLNSGLHGNTGRPFICTPGTLEYHTHPSHLQDSWENYKGKSSFDLGGLLTQIWNAWNKTND